MRITAFKVKVTAKGQNVSVCSDDIFVDAKHFVNMVGIVMHHLEPECRAKRLVYCFQGQGHNKGPYDRNTPVSTISSELLILLLLNLVL